MIVDVTAGRIDVVVGNVEVVFGIVVDVDEVVVGIDVVVVVVLIDVVVGSSLAGCLSWVLPLVITEYATTAPTVITITRHMMAKATTNPIFFFPEPSVKFNSFNLLIFQLQNPPVTIAGSISSSSGCPSFLSGIK